MKMKSCHAAFVAALCCSALFLSSCVYERPVVYSSSGVSYGTSAVWTDASYDANGFPIFGYSYGRPVYGYTAEGAAIFAFAALTAACLVPLWAPAPWYHGHWHYPHHIHRVSVPPHFPHGHHPSRRPLGGLDAPIHRQPHQVLHGHAAAPQHAGNRFFGAKNAPKQPLPQQHHANNRAPQMQVPAQHHANNRAPQMQAPAQHHAPSAASPVRRPDVMLPSNDQQRQHHAAPQRSFAAPMQAAAQARSMPSSAPAAHHGGSNHGIPSHSGRNHHGGHRR